MLFCEPVFLFVFLPTLLIIHQILPNKARNILLATASLLFYALGEWRFLGWLVASIALNYWIAIWIDQTRNTPWAKRLLAIGIVSDLALLIVFKYGGFFVTNLNRVLSIIHISDLPVPNLLLPLGISFFTFHKISYKVDVYRGTAEARRKPMDLALYILLFPQLIAGPIVRYCEIANELVKRNVGKREFIDGITRFITGLGKKMIIANTVAYTADQIFAIPFAQMTAGVAWLGVFCYALQIYFDFSGYSDMAIGLARMFGFHFPENFNYPYISTSITEFWRRWHMSLSRWFRDYVYIPLGGNRCHPLRVYFNLGLVFFLCGLWHGANMNFVIWGIYQGALLTVERLGLQKLLDRMPRILRHAYTMTLVLFGWAIFRATSLRQVVEYISAMVGFAPGDGLIVNATMYLNNKLIIISIIGIIASTPIRHYAADLFQRSLMRATDLKFAVFNSSAAILGIIWHMTIFAYSLLLVAAQTYNPFIYFRF